MITSIARPNGRMGIILPHGALFRAGTEAKIRKELLQRDILETVIGLGPNLFYGTGISACILIFKARKDVDKQNKVLFIDASDQYQKGRNQNFFLEEHAGSILELYEKSTDIENRSTLVPIDQIEENEYNLNIPLYVQKNHIVEEIDLNKTFTELQQAYDEFIDSEDKMKELLKEVGIL